ncbi:hypothetical protein Nepgr_025857 [Nepenthes gracilis]|uniref:Small auxin up regulated protein n=1 Tax=Nepenthes gracilis TaxID=150966 RepID=A0AAD3Y1H0_NEPGR|nr:hypothetical protein Nepgr_025857 [Nepenthes gracilis]
MSNKLAQAAPFRQILKRFSSLGKNCGGEEGSHPDSVPRGHFVVYVGENRSRFILPLSWLAHPQFLGLLQEAEEEYGFTHEMGITIPCEEAVFRSIVGVFH